MTSAYPDPASLPGDLPVTVATHRSGRKQRLVDFVTSADTAHLVALIDGFDRLEERRRRLGKAMLVFAPVPLVLMLLLTAGVVSGKTIVVPVAVWFASAVAFMGLDLLAGFRSDKARLAGQELTARRAEAAWADAPDAERWLRSSDLRAHLLRLPRH